MMTRYTHGTLAWIDLCNPTPEEIREIMEEFSIDPVLMGDLKSPVPQSKSSAHGDKHAVKLILDFPIVKHAEKENVHEIKFIITKKCLITARYEEITALHKFSKEFEVLSTLKKVGKRAHGGHIFVALMEELYRVLEQKLDYIDSRIEEIDESIFAGKERQMVTEISLVNRRLINFRLALSSHKRVLEHTGPLLVAMLGSTFAQHTDSLNTYFDYLLKRVGALSDTLDELRETNNSLLTTRQNEIVKNLTIMAFITFPLSLFASLFGMNTKTLPLAGKSGDFWVIVLIMIFVTGCFFAFFKYKRWL